MQARRWVNQSQPQTLVIAVYLLYFRAVFGLLFNIDRYYSALPGGSTLPRLLVVLGGAAAGYGIANEKKWGYQLGVAVAALPLVAQAYIVLRYQVSPLSLNLLGLLFDVALFALLLHPQSRDYERTWFK